MLKQHTRKARCDIIYNESYRSGPFRNERSGCFIRMVVKLFYGFLYFLPVFGSDSQESVCADRAEYQRCHLRAGGAGRDPDPS